MSDFDEYRNALFPQALQSIGTHLRETAIDALQELCLRLMHLLESEHVKIPDTDEGRIFRLLAIKAVNEVLGYIGCCRGGTSWSAHHQMRSLLEIYAATVHIIAKPSSRAKRVARFAEYPDFLRYRRHLQDLELNLPPEELAKRRFVSTADEESLRPRADHWRALYGERNLLKVAHWHSPSTIRGMFEDLERYQLAVDSEPSDGRGRQARDWWNTYGLICHVTHVSPVGHQAVGSRGFPLLGFARDLSVLREQVGIVIAALTASLIVWDREYLPNARLLERTQHHIEKCIEHVQQSREHGRRFVG